MLSVFIPSFNHARYVTAAIDCARAISVPGKHIYVIDDASTDDTAAVVADYLSKSTADDVTFIRKSENKGVIDSMLTFLGLCQTEYLYVVASDDLAIPEGVVELLGRLTARPHLQFIIGGGFNLMADGERTPIYGRRHDEFFSTPSDKLADRLLLFDPSPLLCQSTVFRTSAFRTVNAVSAEIVADDYAIFAKLFQRYNRRGENFDFAPDVECVLYRHHGSNSYRNLMRQVDTSLQVLEAVAPDRLRDRAIAYKLSFFMLVALKRADGTSLRKIWRRASWRHVPSLVSGLFLNAFYWGKYR